MNAHNTHSRASSQFARDTAAPSHGSHQRCRGGTYSKAGASFPSQTATRGAAPIEPRTHYTPWGWLPIVAVVDTPAEVLEARTKAVSAYESAKAWYDRDRSHKAQIALTRAMTERLRVGA